jgi:GWxTD domain-containing protein
MFRLTFRTIAPLLFFAIVFGLAGAVHAQETKVDNELKGKDLRWLEEEVAPIITAEEENIYRAIDKKDRKLFKEIFWSRRDPQPRTKDNEFEDEFKNRRKAADKQYKSKGVKGYATDMGKVFILLGPPTRTEGSGPNATWHYDPNAKAGLPDGLTVKFAGGKMEASEDLEKSLELARNRLVTNPTVMYVRSMEGRLLEPRTSDPNSPANQILTALRETKSTAADVPFETSFAYFRAAAGQIYIPILYEIDASTLTWQGDESNVAVFGLVENTEGFPMYQFDEPTKLKKASDGRTLAEIPVQLQPGKYTLYTGVRDNQTATAGTKIVELEVPDYFTGEFGMSSVVVYNMAQETTDQAGIPGHAFQFGTVKFQPAHHFTKDDAIGFFFFVYGLGNIGGAPNITGQYIFYLDGARKGATKDEALQANESQAVGNAEIPLSGFEPGNYKLRIKITDHVLNKTLNEEIEFVVEGESATQ